METKFIGLEGFNEIESLSSRKVSVKQSGKKSSRRNLTKTQKTVRFIKRVSLYCAKSAARISKNAAAKLSEQILGGRKQSTQKKSRTSAGVRVGASDYVRRHGTQPAVIDRLYVESRTGTDKSAKEIMSALSFKSAAKNKYERAGASRFKISKKKAVLAVAACVSAVMLSFITVASALDADVTPENSVSSSAPTQPQNNGEFSAASTDEAFPLVSSISTDDMAQQIESMSPKCAGLYIDGELIGVTAQVDELNAALDKVLTDYRKDYDDETTTEFANSVKVVSGNPTNDDLLSADKIIALADGKFSISLSTDIVYTTETDYDTEVEYDENKSSSYKKVKTEGVNGEQEVTVRVTYVDGIQADAVQTDLKTIKEAINEVIVKGSASESSSSSSSSSSSDSSSSSSSVSSSSSSGLFSWPLPYTHTLSSTFGTRWGRLHGGIDIAASGVSGQSICAAASGTVTFAGYDSSGYGNYVMIDHGNGYVTLYGHCSSLAVSAGQTVSTGDVIGYVGSTGNSTGPHLHFEIRVNGTKVDPLQYVS